jgi:hypothetical protein
MMDPAELDRMIQQHEQQQAAEAEAEGDDDDDDSQESAGGYGDENAVPVDPALGGGPSTPLRAGAGSVTRTVHTVSKVPLKPADDSTPDPRKKRHSSASAMRPRAARMSLSPAKLGAPSTNDDAAIQQALLVASPARSERGSGGGGGEWAAEQQPGTPARPGVNPALLAGATVHVDVRTSDGADASGIFVELLTQMGATCVEHWDWTPEKEEQVGGGGVGVTHVVFKDGDKATTDRARQAGGVHCVGVGWVLE